jgi:mRNA-degrading endonuclease RelE of RelBE toxin-antitoxin system
MTWSFIITKTFKRLFKNKSREMQERAKDKIIELSAVENPLQLGEKKGNLGFYAINLNHSDRIAYTVDFKAKEIFLLKVCSHKQVYGKD